MFGFKGAMCIGGNTLDTFDSSGATCANFNGTRADELVERKAFVALDSRFALIPLNGTLHDEVTWRVKSRTQIVHFILSLHDLSFTVV